MIDEWPSSMRPVVQLRTTRADATIALQVVEPKSRPKRSRDSMLRVFLTLNPTGFVPERHSAVPRLESPPVGAGSSGLPAGPGNDAARKRTIPPQAHQGKFRRSKD